MRPVHPPRPCLRGLPFPEAHPAPQGCVALPGPGAGALQGPSPLWGATRVRARGRDLHRPRTPLASPLLRTRPGRPPPRSPRLTCSADTAPFPAPLPLLLPARPLLSAIFAACRASGAQRGPAVRHFRPRRPPARPAPPPPLGSPARVPRAAVAVASCRPYPRPAGCGEFPPRTPPREGRGGRGAGSGCRAPRPPRGGGNEGGRPPLGDPGLGRDCAESVQLRRCAGGRRGGENPGSSSKVTRGAETSGRGQGLGLMRDREVEVSCTPP